MGESSLWVWLRRAFFVLIWLNVIAIAFLFWVLWQIFPGEILGVGWEWAAGAACVAMAVMALDALLEIGDRPLPPEVPPQEEIKHWLLFIIAIPGVAAIFAADFWVLVFMVHLVQGAISRLPHMIQVALLANVCVAWFMGTFYILYLLSNFPWISRFRRFIRYRLLRLHTSEAEILRLLEATELPDRVKATFARRIRRHGMSRRIAESLLQALEVHLSGKTSRARALLAQSLYNWLEEHNTSG